MAYTAKREPIAAPTIGHLRGQGLTTARVFCASIWCGHMILVPFDDLELSDRTPFPEIKTHRRWSCERCGGRKMSVIPDWRDLNRLQAERTGRDISQHHQPLADPGS